MSDGWQLRGWRDDRDLAHLTAHGATGFTGMIPDAVFVQSLRSDGAKDEHFPWILELDRGTESVFSIHHPMKDWTAKIERYRTYLAGPVHHDPLWRGIGRSPRVLTLTSSITRRDNLIEATANAGGDDRFWFATYQPLLVDLDPRPLFWASDWYQPSGEIISLSEFVEASRLSLIAS